MYRSTLFIFCTVVVATFFACSSSTESDSDNNKGPVSQVGTLSVNGTEYELTKLYIDHEGYDSFSDNYDIDLLLFSEEVSFDGNTNKGTTDGSGVQLDMSFSADEVTSGTFKFSKNSDDNSFSDFSDAFTSPGDYREYFSGGDLEITIDGSTYSIEGNMVDDNGDKVTFSYSGSVTEEFQADS